MKLSTAEKELKLAVGVRVRVGEGWAAVSGDPAAAQD